MKAVMIREFGDPDVLVGVELPVPEPRPGEVLVRVHASSINRPDLVQREGRYPPPPGDSEIPGVEVAGVIERLGEGVSGWQPGERVMSLVGGGGYAEYACARAAHLLRIPSSMSFDEAACVCESYLTAYLNVFMLGRLQPTETVLLHGGGGGVNTAALQLCRALTPDVRCLVTAAPDKIERVRGLGADCVIDYTSTGDFSTIVQEQTANRGVDVILDHVGAKYLEPNMKSLAYAGRLVVIGVISGIKAELNLALMMVKRQQIIGSVIRSRPVDEKAQLVATFAGHGLPSFAARDIVPIIDAVFPLEAAADAHRMMEADRHFGKIVLRVRDD